MPRFYSGNSLGVSIQTGEIDDGAVTLDKLSGTIKALIMGGI